MSSNNIGQLKKVFVIVRQKLSCSKVKQTLCSTSTSTRWSGVVGFSDYESSSAYNQEHRLRRVQPAVRYFTEIDPESKEWHFGKMFNRSEYNSMEEYDFATRQSSQAVKSRGARLLWFCACPAKIHQHPHSMEAWNQNIEWFMVSLENGFYWRRTTRVRVDRFPRAHNTAVASWDPKDDDREQDPTWTVQRSNHLHVDVQRHLLETISWEVEAYAQKCPQSRWSIGHSSNREPKKNGTERTLAGQTFCGAALRGWWCFASEVWTSCISGNKSIRPRIFEKQTRERN